MPIIDIAPGVRLDEALRDLRRHLPNLADRRDLPDEIADLLSEHCLTSLCLPAARGGQGQPLSTLLRAVERVSALDAGVGWCLFILGSAPWLLCHAEEALAAEVFSDPTARVGGSLAPTGTARRVGNGYLLDGRWSFGSGVSTCDWVVVRAVLADAGPDASALFVVPREQVTTEPWDGLGLSTSGSGAFGLRSVTVPGHRLIPRIDGPARWPEFEFRLPFRATFAAGAAVLLGIADQMLAEFVALAAGAGPWSGQARVHGLVGRATGAVNAARFTLYESVRQLEQACVDGTPSARSRAQARVAVVRVREYCLDVVDEIHLAVGASGVSGRARFARLFLDAHTASQHKMFSADVDQLAGAVLLGHRDDDRGL